jgi:hypothetical protein
MPILDNLEAYIEHKLNIEDNTEYEDYDLELANQNLHKDQDRAV